MINWNSIPVIGDDNYRDFIDPVVDGQKMFCARTPRDMSATPLSGFRAAPLLKLKPLDRSEVVERIKERRAKKAMMRDLLDYLKVAIKNQQRTNYCWMFAVIRLLEATRAMQGQRYVSLSPASCACIIKNFNNVGGYGLEALEFLGKVGPVPSSMWPDTAIDRRLKTAETNAIRAQFKSDEFGQLELGDLDQLNAWLLQYGPAAVGLNWWGHEVLLTDVELDSRNNFVYCFDNSWGTGWGDGGRGILTASKARGDYVVMRSAIPSN